MEMTLHDEVYRLKSELETTKGLLIRALSERDKISEKSEALRGRDAKRIECLKKELKVYDAMDGSQRKTIEALTIENNELKEKIVDAETENAELKEEIAGFTDGDGATTLSAVIKTPLERNKVRDILSTAKEWYSIKELRMGYREPDLYIISSTDPMCDDRQKEICTFIRLEIALAEEDAANKKQGQRKTATVSSSNAEKDIEIFRLQCENKDLKDANAEIVSAWRRKREEMGYMARELEELKSEKAESEEDDFWDDFYDDDDF